MDYQSQSEEKKKKKKKRLIIDPVCQSRSIEVDDEEDNKEDKLSAYYQG